MHKCEQNGIHIICWPRRKLMIAILTKFSWHITYSFELIFFSALYLTNGLQIFLITIISFLGIVVYAYYQDCDPIKAEQLKKPNQESNYKHETCLNSHRITSMIYILGCTFERGQHHAIHICLPCVQKVTIGNIVYNDHVLVPFGVSFSAMCVALSL